MEKTVKEENGDVLVFTAIVMGVVILFFAFCIDLGFYFIKYENAREVTEVSAEEINSMGNYYAFIDDPLGAFSSVVSYYVSQKGDSFDDVSVSLTRSYSGAAGSEKANIHAKIVIKDTYNTIMMRLIGISTVPVKVTKTIDESVFIGKRWSPGMPEEDWTGPVSPPSPEPTEPSEPEE